MASKSRGEERALEFITKGDKALNKFSLFGGDSKYENAKELYQKAANQYKVEKLWSEAGDAFVKVAECEIKMKSQHEAASTFKDAASCFKKSNPEEAYIYFNEAITLYCEIGRFTTAGKLEKEIAEIHEGEGETEEAIEHYQKAADYFTGEDQHSAANPCLLKVAYFSAELEKYESPIEIFEDIGKASLASNLLKFNAKSHFLDAGILKIVSGDTVAANLAIQKYTDLDYTFASSRECQFLVDLVAAVEAFDEAAFTDHVFNYDNISKLVPWRITMLLRVKEKLKSDGGEGEEDDLT